jgi:hypothetical protein
MADDLRNIFDRAALDMRPEFEAQLRALLDEPRPDLWLVPHDDAAVVVDVDHSDEPERRSLARRMWPFLLAAAAALVLFLAVGRQTSPPAPATLPPPANCAMSAETIGTVPATEVVIRVGMMPDGKSFCLADDATGAPIGPISLVTGPEQSAALDQPAITFHTTVAGIARVWVITVPDGMPAERVSSPDMEVVSFPSRVDRRLLVIHPIRQGSEPTGEGALQVFSGRDLLATLAVDDSEEAP